MLEHLVSANLYLGFHLTFRHASMVRFLMIPRSRVDIFDLSITIYSIRLALNLFQKIYITRGICWLHGYLETLLVKPIRFITKPEIYSFGKLLRRQMQVKRVFILFFR